MTVSAEERTKLLIVDDQPANLIALEAALAGSGHEILQAQSGREALAHVERNDFAMILLDVQMPILDGFETARLIRKIAHAKTTPIIFLTANFPSDETIRKGYESGAVDYLFKPVNIDILRAKVSFFVELFTKNLELQRQSELLRQAENRAKELELARIKRIGERKYQNLVEGIRDGIVWSFDPLSNRFTFVSQHAERIAGYPLEAWLREAGFWEKHLHPEDRARVLQVLQEASSGRQGNVRFEHRFIQAGGEILWFHTEAHLEGEGPELELRGLSVDITHLKATERALTEAVRVRDEFLSIASHELKTPITPLQLQLQGFMRMIEMGRINDVSIGKLKEMLDISEAQVSRLGRLIGQLLDVSRINAGRLSLEIEKINLTDLIRGVIEQLRHDIHASRCEFRMELEPGISGHWDRLRIEQVLINLLTNALKYGHGKPIEIELRGEADRVRFTVKDHGIGIGPDNHQRIFERFERAVSSRNYGGLGLGLYISRQIIELHRGSIQVRSELGQGAAFTVELPRY